MHLMFLRSLLFLRMLIYIHDPDDESMLEKINEGSISVKDV